MYWNRELETLAPEALEALQVERLRWTAAQASGSPFYGKVFAEQAIRPESIKGLQDIRRLPFTTKDDLRAHFPYGLLAVDRRETIRLHVSSGTTGQATVVLHSRRDIEHWADLVARCMYMTGVRADDVFQNLTGYGLFPAGLASTTGARGSAPSPSPPGPGTPNGRSTSCSSSVRRSFTSSPAMPCGLCR